MSQETARTLGHLHQWIGWLAAAVLLFPSVLLAQRARRFPALVAAVTAFVSLAMGIGALIYPAYSRLLRRAVYLASPSHGLLFERKEHLAFAAIALTWTGALLHLRGGASEDEGWSSRARAAHWAFIGAAMLTTVVAILGTLVSRVRSF